MTRLVERSVQGDEEMLYGVFLGADGKVWTYVPPATLARAPGAHPDVSELGIDQTAAARPRAESATAHRGRAGGVRVLQRRHLG